MENFSEVLLKPLQNFWDGFVEFIPNLLAMIVIIAGGLVLSWIVRVVVHKVLAVIGFDTWCDKVGITAIIRKGDMWSKPSEVFSKGLFWLLVLVVLVVGLSALRLQLIDTFTVQFFNYLPRALSAILILVIGYAIAGFAGRAVLIAAVNSGYTYAKFIAQAVRVLVIVVTLAMAFEQLQIAPGIVMAAFSIVFGGIVLAFSIAFGVGGIESARKTIEGSTGWGSEEKPQEEGEKTDEPRDIDYL